MRITKLTVSMTVVFASLAFGASDPAESGKSTALAGVDRIDPAPTIASAPAEKVTWRPLIEQSFFFLGIQHSFRLATEPGTRNGTRGSYFKGYARAVGNLHGWGDGDPFYVNYIGHPIQGGVTNWLWANNDPKYYHVEFGRDREYWRSRLRATAFSLAYSSQFELGPLSEASIGQIQARYPQQGFVDHVVTPALGLGWMLAEDALDRFLIKKIEARTDSRWVRLLARGGLNPTRSAANALRGKAPWHRDGRPGVLAYDAATFQPVARRTPAPTPDVPGAAPFEVTFLPVTSFYGGHVCAGGGAQVAFRLQQEWQWLGEVSGCQMSNMAANTSADTLLFLTGPSWRPATRGKLSPHMHVLVGGQKVSQEELLPEVRAQLKPTALREEYARFTTRTGWMMAVGAGLEMKLNAALALRLATFDYMKSWMPPVDRVDYGTNVRLSSGVVLRLGNW